MTRPKRACSVKGERPVLNGLNAIFKKRLLDLSSNESVGSSKASLKENCLSPLTKRLRSNVRRNISNGVLQESNSSIDTSCYTPIQVNKKSKVLRSQSCLSKPDPIADKLPTVKTPANKVLRKPSVVKSRPSVLTSQSANRYLLRSHSTLNRPALSDHLFLTPQLPRKPLSEMHKKLTPISRCSTSNLSQISEYSNASSNSLSALLLSRFVKKNSKGCNLDSTKKKKHIRIIESSFENADSSSCASIGDESQCASLLPQDHEKRILDLCDQTEIRPWPRYLKDEFIKPLHKIGEGVYGEVFRLNDGDVLKIFPVDGDILANGEDQMTMEDVYPEVFVSRKLTELSDQVKLYRAPNFVQLKKAALLNGKLPRVLIEHWHVYKDEKGSDNECLEFLPEKQKWMALQYEFAGEPLSDYKFNCYGQIRGIVEQIVLSLAVAESGLQFEHRDLHWQNILIKPTKQTKLRYVLNGRTYWGHCNGIFVTIIDFTVARMCVDTNTVYMDMADCPEIFEGEGDYQCDIYRMMKDDNKNNWREFHPRSNLYWVHYLLDKLLHETSYPRGDPQSKSIELELRELYNRVLSYSSAQQLVDRDEYFAVTRTTADQ